MKHRHAWVPAVPIDPVHDRGNLAARIGHQYGKTTYDVCDCGAGRMVLWTNRRRNIYVTRANGRLWRGRHRFPGVKTRRVTWEPASSTASAAL